jgi:hypothetical protein
MSDSYQAKVCRGEISRAQFLRDMHRANAHNEHPIGHRLKDSGLYDHECVQAYYKAMGEPPPIPQVMVARLVRRTIFQLEEVGEIHQPRPTNYADRAPWLYRLLHRSLVETSEQYVEYEPAARVKLSDAEIDRLRPQPLGTAPHYDGDIKPTPKMLELFRAWLR